MDMTAADALVGTTLAHRYRVESKIANGGMATVFLAHDLRLDRRVALKVMHANLARDPQFVQRFINEALAVAKLSHPNVVQVYDQGSDQGHVYLAMEYVAGQTLRAALKARTRFSPAEALRIMVPILAGLGAAHQAGMVHRDMKPENVLITHDGQIKVADFGLARAAEASQQGLTKTGTLMGTAAYLSPEQITHSTADARSDVYACGIMLYELLTGRQPHTGDSPIAVAYQHVNEDVPRPSRVVPGIPPEVDSLVVRATERDPAYRLANAGQFLAAVFAAQKALDEQPSAAVTSVMEMAPARAGDTAEDSDNATRTLQGVELPPVEYDDYEDDRPPRPSLRTPLLVATVLLLVVAVGFGWWMVDGRYETVPDLVGVESDEARRDLRMLGFRVQTAEEPAYSDEAPPGTVAATDPEAGSRLLPDTLVTLILSAGPQYVEMPDVEGASVAEARDALKEVGLTDIVEDEITSFDNPPGTVITTKPAPGEKANREESVTLTISAGFPMPNVVGQKVDDARRLLESSDLEVTVVEEHHDEVPEGHVISQDPEAETTVGAGQSVTLTVSSGPELVEVPDIRGWKVDKARKELEERGFEVTVHQVIGNRVGDYNPKGEAPKGSTIEIWTSPFGRERDRDRGREDRLWIGLD
ncbi:Stk1 family PASTA domain-containing Ser/Thr kinase [Thermobifida fusca]|uniref:Stk1 family PASTA domain-containing Ser/Thr kinase n=1 Tax=Thermobifida fusca TaxID=2021 RepID=UPI00187840BB|nr:Stk1 family PASTA domain-containing Ser/Thr kinase [Thermobifida fusca]QOS57700.1 Stk1 family PASTA domain-containing Ser/Thr kinase [Thermobifida fusca]